MTPADCIRAAIPDASDALCDHIMWGRTPFPFLKLGARAFYKAASRYHRAARNNIRLCDFCDRPAVQDQWTCASCDTALRSAQQSPAVAETDADAQRDDGLLSGGNT